MNHLNPVHSRLAFPAWCFGLFCCAVLFYWLIGFVVWLFS